MNINPADISSQLEKEKAFVSTMDYLFFSLNEALDPKDRLRAITSLEPKIYSKLWFWEAPGKLGKCYG